MVRDNSKLTTFGTLSIGVGAIVGGGFFATFGIAVAGAKGATPLSFLIAAVLALLTAYSYIGLTLRFPGPGGTVAFIAKAFGLGLLPASLNVLLILSYVAIMGVYASALAAYSLPYLPEQLRPLASHAICSLALIVLGFVNFAGASMMERLEGILNVGKLILLVLFVAVGLLADGLVWDRLGPSAWATPSAIVASGMIGFLAYEGFELIANASDRIATPAKTLPIAFLGSVLIAMAIYVLAFVVGIGHLPLSALLEAKDFAISAAAGSFLGPFGFGAMAIGAVLASASAINADYFGAAKLPPQLAMRGEMPSAFHRSLHGKSTTSLVLIGMLALVAVNFVSIEALSSATSGGFLMAFMAVNIAAVRLADDTGANRLVPAIAASLCFVALSITVWEFLAQPSTLPQAISMGAIALLAIVIELGLRSRQRVV